MNKPVKPKVMAKPKPRAKVAPVKPKAKVTKSRGSNTAKQIGDMNQRESFNAYRGITKQGVGGNMGETKGKVTSKQASDARQANRAGGANSGTAIAARIQNQRRKSQRAGGKGK
jgi:hypothetical protein